MKKIILGILAVVTAMFAFGGCDEAQIESIWGNSSSIVDNSIDSSIDSSEEENEEDR